MGMSSMGSQPGDSGSGDSPTATDSAAGSSNTISIVVAPTKGVLRFGELLFLLSNTVSPINGTSFVPSLSPPLGLCVVPDLPIFLSFIADVFFSALCSQRPTR